jgi:hypothetical protein
LIGRYKNNNNLQALAAGSTAKIAIYFEMVTWKIVPEVIFKVREQTIRGGVP